MEYIRFRTGLGPVAERQSGMRLGLYYRQASHEFVLDGDLTSLGGLIREGLRNLVAGLAKTG